MGTKFDIHVFIPAHESKWLYACVSGIVFASVLAVWYILCSFYE